MKKYISILLLTIISFAEIKPDGKTNVYVEKSNNGVEIINISTPSAKGVSDSTFNDFSIDNTGAVINNATGIGRSHIAGLVNPNKNLKEPARLALLRVTSTNKSELKGVLEALTKDDLDVILSNKNGITLDGVKFLNIHEMTLTTGEVILKNGYIDNISVGDGIIVSLDELNTNNINKLNILSKVARLEKDVIANKLDIETGNNVYSINGENIEIVKTLDGEIGVPISSEILGSVYADNVKIVATKSGIGVKNIISETAYLDSKTQANINKILSNNLTVKVEEDFTNKNNIIANNNLEIIAKNIFNKDNSVLISNNISLTAKEKIENTNGSLIYANDKLSIRAKTLDNIGEVVSFGTYEKRWKAFNGDIFTEKTLDRWLLSNSDSYSNFNFFRWSETDSAKRNAVEKFYKKGSILLGDKYSYLLSKYKEKYKEEHINTLKFDNDYSGSLTLTKDDEDKKTLRAFLSNKGKKTNFSVLSGKNVDIQVENVVNNKDAKILADDNNLIKTKEFNNASSISDESILLQDGRETVSYSGDRTCWGLGLLFCSIKHNVKYERALTDGKIVHIKATPSKLTGNNIEINADVVNFKAYDKDRVKQTTREEDEVLEIKKQSIDKNTKEVEIKEETRDIYTKLNEFYKTAMFLDNISYDKSKLVFNEFKIHDDKLKEIEENITERINKKSNITVNASKLNVYDQKLIYNNIKLSSNDISIIGADIEATKNLDLKGNNIQIASIKEKENISVVNRDDKGFFTNHESRENISQESLRRSTLTAENINIDTNKLNIKASDISANEDINIKADEVNIESEKTKETRDRYNDNRFLLSFNKVEENEINEKSNASNIEAKNIKIDSKKTLVKGSNIVSDDLDIKGKLLVENDINKSEKNVDKKSFNLIDATSNVTSNSASLKLSLFDYNHNTINSVYENNVSSNILAKNKAKLDKVNVQGSNLVLNNAVISKIDSNSSVLNNKEDISSFRSGLDLNLNLSTSGIGAGLGLNISNTETKENSKDNINSNIVLLGKNKIEDEAKFTSTNLKYDNLEVNSEKIIFDANKDIKDIISSNTSFGLGINVNIGSPILNDVAKIGEGVKNLAEARFDRAISNGANGFTGAVNDLASNIKVKDGNGNYRLAKKEDLGKNKLIKDVSGYVNIGGKVGLDISNQTIKEYNEKVKSTTLTGNKLTFNNNKEVKYVSTNVKDTKIEYNNVQNVVKDVKFENNTKKITEISAGIGVSANLNPLEGKLVPGAIDLSLKGSNENINEKVNSLNTLENVSETFNNVQNVKLKGVESKNSNLKGNISNLEIEEIKNEHTKNKVGLGADISLSFSGVSTGGNGEIVDTRKEKAYKQELDLSNLKVDNISKKEVEENNHDYQIGLRAGTSGVTTKLKVNDVVDLNVDLSASTINALKNPDEFKHKMNLASKDVESTFKGLKSKVENISKTTNDELTDISEEEKRSFIELSNYHLNAEYIVREINKKEAETKQQREKLTEEIGFKDLKVLEKLTEENVNELPEGLKKRYYELKQRGEELRVAVDREGNVYTFGDLSELDFKKALARELGIHSNGRITKEDKLLGATSGNIYSEYVINGSEKVEELEKDSITDIPSDIEVVSDLTNSGKALDHFIDNLSEIDKKQLELAKKYDLSSSERMDKLIKAGGRLIESGGKLVVVYGLSVGLDTLGYAAIPITSGISLPISQGLKYIGYVVMGGQIIYIANETTVAIQNFEEAITGKENENKVDLRDINPKLYDAGSELLDLASLGVLTVVDNIPKDSKKYIENIEKEDKKVGKNNKNNKYDSKGFNKNITVEEMRESAKKEIKIKYSYNEYDKLERAKKDERIRKIESNNPLEEAKRFFSKRVKPETIIKHKGGAITGVGYNGEVYTIRDHSKMGNNPVTIDINGFEFKKNKIKFLKK